MSWSRNLRHHQIVFLFSPGGLGDMSYNDRILEGVQRFKMENGDIDIYIYSPESLQEAEKIFADWLERPQSSIPVLFVLGSSDYEPMAELYLAEHDLTPNKSILLFESRKQYKDEEHPYLPDFDVRGFIPCRSMCKKMF